MLMEDNLLNANAETGIARDVIECGTAEVTVGSGLLSGRPTVPPIAHSGGGGAIRSECPRAWGGSNYSAMDFEGAYRMYSRRVYSKCLHMVRNEAEAEDLTQEVFLQLFRKMDSFRGESAFSTWLYRVAVNVVLMHLRRKSLTATSLEEAIELKEGIFSLHQVLGAPDAELTTAIDRLNLERAVRQMPPGYRRVFLMYHVEGYGHREIAQILGTSVSTSKSQLFKARVRLRQLLCAGESKQLQGGISSQPRPLSQRAGRRRSRSQASRFAGSCG
jgi:RNA polymerase sigma-70 factor (ECF subfamily)